MKRDIIGITTKSGKDATIIEVQEGRMLFKDVLSKSMKLVGMDEEECARYMCTSRDTIIRWLSGSTVPRESMCELVCIELRNKACNRYQQIREITKPFIPGE